MTAFGDVEPEDAWDATDPLAVQLANLVARTEALTGRPVRTGASDPADLLDALAQLVAGARRRHLTARDVVRADELDADLAVVRARL